MARGVKAGAAREEALLTEEYLEGLKPGAARRFVWDTTYPGFAVRVYPSGVLTFYLVRKHEGRTEYLSLGSWPAVKCDKARKKAAAKGGKYAEGVSPVVAKRAEKAATRAAVLLSEAWEAYRLARLASGGEKRAKAVSNEVLTWNRHLAPTFGKRPLSGITRAEVARWHAAASVKRERPRVPGTTDKRGCRTVGGAVAANRAKALLSAIFGHWARVTGSDLANPCVGVRKNRESARGRYLTAGELRKWWEAVLAAPADDAEALALLLLTATRSGTLRRMDWAEIDWQGRLWNVPGDKLKSGRAWVVPLNGPAFGVLRARWTRKERPEAGPVFTGTADGPRTDLKGPWKRVVKAAGIATATVHDARRTAATVAADAGVDSAVVAHLLQHVGASVLDVYRRVTPATAAAASEKLAEALLKPAGLVPGDFAAGLPKPEAMRPEPEAGKVLDYRQPEAVHAVGLE